MDQGAQNWAPFLFGEGLAEAANSRFLPSVGMTKFELGRNDKVYRVGARVPLGPRSCSDSLVCPTLNRCHSEERERRGTCCPFAAAVASGTSRFLPSVGMTKQGRFITSSLNNAPCHSERRSRRGVCFRRQSLSAVRPARARDTR